MITSCFETHFTEFFFPGRSVRVPCKQCPCQAFSFIPGRPEDIGEFWFQRRRDFDPTTWRAKCRCKHTHEEHTCTGMRRCRMRSKFTNIFVSGLYIGIRTKHATRESIPRVGKRPSITGRDV